jgi:tetratricopeptide (TPR) repeat protein
MFVGREAELAELRHGLEQSVGGRGALYLVYGEPGIGKTRLCDELSAHAATRGVALFWGRCWEAFDAPAYWPWLDVLSALCRELDGETLDKLLGDGRAALATILPELRTAGAAPASLPAQEARVQLFRAVSALLRRVASTRGLLLVLEDLHAADESSLLLLHFVARELRSMRVFLLVTFRDVEAQLSASVGEAIGRLTREGTSMSLGRLSQIESEQLLRARAAGLADDDFAALYRRTQGNPLFLQELAALCLSQGSAALAGGKLPQSVREVLRERLSRTAEGVRDALEIAAIGGDVIDPPLLAAALELPLAELEERLSLAESAGVIVRRAAGGFGFFHALAREVLAHDPDAERRRGLHAALARAIAQRAGRLASTGLETPYLELAHHWLEAGAEALPEALRCAFRAAEQAIARFAFEEAVSVLERAHAAVQAVPSATRLRAEVLIALGQAQIQRGAGSVGQALCLEAAALARDQRDAELLARAALAFGLEIKAALIDRALIALLEEALAALPAQDSPLRVQIMARLGAAMQPHHDLRYPIRLAEAAIAAARRIGDPATLLYALTTGMSAMMDIVDPRVRLPLNLEAEQLAQSQGDRERVLRSLVRLTFDHMELGDLPAADAHIAHFERLTREAKAARYAWRVPLFHSMRAMMHGRFQESEELLERAHELGTRAEDPQLSRCHAFHREGLLRAWERHAEMAAFDLTVRPLRAAFYSGPHWQNGGSAFTYSRLESVEQTQLYLDLIPQEDWPLVHNPPAFAHLGEPLALCGSEALVRRVYELLLPAAHRCVSWGFTKFIWDGTATRVLGLLAARLGRYDEADAHFSAALTQLERMDAQVYLARTRYEYGRFLLSLARPADRDRALRLIEAALENARTLDMRGGLCRLAERQLSAAANAPARAAEARDAPPTHPDVPPEPGVPQRTPRSDSEAGANDAATRLAAGAGPLGFSFASEGEFWTITHAAGSFRLRDSLGLHYLARLFAEPDRPIHALELSSGDAQAANAVLSGGDAGEMLDERAVLSYRHRAQTLEAELAEAEAWNDSARTARAREELEFLQAELARAVGLGGRVRKSGNSSERARSAVQRRIRNVLERVRSHAPDLAEFLERSVKTGTYCVFRPSDARSTPPSA